jgi:hypothetical protein
MDIDGNVTRYSRGYKLTAIPKAEQRGTLWLFSLSLLAQPHPQQRNRYDTDPNPSRTPFATEIGQHSLFLAPSTRGNSAPAAARRVTPTPAKQSRLGKDREKIPAESKTLRDNGEARRFSRLHTKYPTGSTEVFQIARVPFPSVLQRCVLRGVV